MPSATLADETPPNHRSRRATSNGVRHRHSTGTKADREKVPGRANGMEYGAGDEVVDGVDGVDGVDEVDGVDGVDGVDRLDGVRQRRSPGAMTVLSASQRSMRFAPLRVPLRRRKQTLAVFMHCSSIMVCVPVFFFLCAMPLAWPLVIPYVVLILFSSAATDGQLRWRSQRFRRLAIWRWFAEYFPSRLVKTAELPAQRKYIFGYHPHGIISHGAWAAFGTEGLGFADKFPGITNCLLTLESNFSIPFYREYLLLAGMRSVSRQSIVNHLSRGGADGRGQGRAVTIVVGGARESLQANPGTMRLVLHGRYGFVKVAMATGADLVPVLGFGEVDLYEQLQGDDHPLLRRFQMHVLRVWKFTLPFMRGRGIFNYDYGLMPYRRPLHIVVGRPIPTGTPPADNGSALDPAEVERLHGLYCAELRRLWDTYKDEYMPDRVEEIQFLA